MGLIEISENLSYSTHFLKMLSEENKELASATGFVYLFEGEYFMITNWHNVTGIHPFTRQRLNKISAAFPVRIETRARQENPGHEGLALSNPLEIHLYEDEYFEKPMWYIHPKGISIDVVAIPIEKVADIPTNIRFFPINKFAFDTGFDIKIPDDVFVLGYPFNLSDGLDFPIWKRGTIASEPKMNVDNESKFLIDSASRSGMSGAPVIMRRSTLYSLGPPLSLSDFIGYINVFAGVYGGRLYVDDPYDAQMGIVYKSEVIEEILKAKIRGGSEFRKASFLS